MNWDPFQREVLAELGHVLYRQAGSGLAGDTETVRRDAPGIEAAAVDDPMLARIARAAGMTGEAVLAHIGDAAVIADLRGNPTAKRALWPHLRAMRRRPG